MGILNSILIPLPSPQGSEYKLPFLKKESWDKCKSTYLDRIKALYGPLFIQL
jgi:hypothetical protein